MQQAERAADQRLAEVSNQYLQPENSPWARRVESKPNDNKGSAMASKKEDGGTQKSGNYRHKHEAVQRPDAGIQPEFNKHKQPKSYRYDSSLAPELNWDENAEREFAE